MLKVSILSSQAYLGSRRYGINLAQIQQQRRQIARAYSKSASLDLFLVFLYVLLQDRVFRSYRQNVVVLSSLISLGIPLGILASRSSLSSKLIASPTFLLTISRTVRPITRRRRLGFIGISRRAYKSVLSSASSVVRSSSSRLLQFLSITIQIARRNILSYLSQRNLSQSAET